MASGAKVNDGALGLALLLTSRANWSGQSLGYASYFEDIQKVRDEFVHLRSVSSTLSVTDLAARNRALNGQIDLAIASLDKLLDLATDPSITLAFELAEALSTVSALQNELTETTNNFREKIQSADRFVLELKEQISRLKEEKRAAERDARAADKAFNDLASRDFGAVIPLYPPRQ